MARIPVDRFHSLSRVYSKGRILVFCRCKTTALDRVTSELEAQAVYDRHVAEANALHVVKDDSHAAA